jgi:phosphoglucosamine mutase
MFVDENGSFVDGNIPLALLSKKYLEVSDKVVCSVNTGRTVVDAVEKNGGEISYAPVGAVFTALKCIDEGIIFGGQPNGHLMDSEFVPYDSGSLFALLVPGLIIEEGKNFSEMIQSLEKYDSEKFNYSTDEKNELMLNIREKANSRDLILHEKFNALKLDFEKFSALLRPSGSEDVIRVTLEGEEVSKEDISEVKEFIKGLE